MEVFGIDFTSRPSRRKPITCMRCVFRRGVLEANDLVEWADFEGFESGLSEPGRWIAGLDFPFGQSRTFIENIGWPNSWAGYVAHARALDRDGYRHALDDYRVDRAYGDKEHLRATDRAARSSSPQKLYGVPVGLMFYEGAPRLLKTGVSIPGVHDGDPERITVEAYPGVLARTLVGRQSYKSDTKKKQTPAQRDVRRSIMRRVRGTGFEKIYGFTVRAPMVLADDPSGGQMDALLCAIQASWAWSMRLKRFGAPADLDPLEGWIADPLFR